jgi:hypothetical protein
MPSFDQPKTAGEAARIGFRFFEQLQTDDGHWAGEYGGPMFLMPGLVITCYLTGVDLCHPQRVEMIRYLRNRQLQDGSWGLHIEGDGTILGTACNYVTMRLLGVGADDLSCVRAREFLKQHGNIRYYSLEQRILYSIPISNKEQFDSSCNTRPSMQSMLRFPIRNNLIVAVILVHQCNQCSDFQ